MAATCNQCKTEIAENFCPNCGHPAVLKRIDGRYVFQEILNVLNFEKGILFTMRELAIHPGKSITGYLHENRNRLVKPIVFLVVASLVYTISNNYFHFEKEYVNFPDFKESVMLAIFKWVQGNYGYANLIMSFFIGMWMKVFFRKYLLNFFEILIVLCYAMGMGMLVYSVFGIVQGLTHIKLMQIAVIVGFFYVTYAIGQFYDRRKPFSYFKALIAYLLGMMAFSIAAFAMGIVMDLIVRK
jgi:hypothetical protein